MACPRVGRAFQLPVGSNKSTIDEVSCLSADNVTILCIRSNGSQLQLRSIQKVNKSLLISSLKLTLPKEASNRVVQTELLSIYPRLLVNVLTLTGTLITLDLSKFLVNGCLPEVIQTRVEPRSSINSPAGSISSANVTPKRISLFEMSVGSQGKEKGRFDFDTSGGASGSSNGSGSGSGSTEYTVNSNVKFDQYLPTSLNLQQTLKLAINIEELHLDDYKDFKEGADYSPLCGVTSLQNQGSLLGKENLSSSSWRNKEISRDDIIQSYIGCLNGNLLISTRQVDSYF